MADFACVPIVLLGFNRADSMSALIDAIRLAKPKSIYIAVDGPREAKQNDIEQCRTVRNCVSLIDWPCEIKTLFREKNLGCKYAVSSAITWFFENEEMGIILEDDCRPTIDFLRFATEMLERYKDDLRIGAVCGFNTFNLQSDKKASYHFSRHMDVWGWASWRRVWQCYDAEMLFCGKNADLIINKSVMTSYYKKMFRGFVRAVNNGLSSWAIPFSVLSLSKGWLNIVPFQRLVANAGLADDRATHTGGYIYWGKDWSKAGAIEFPLVHPSEVVCDDAADRIRERIEGAIFPRGLTWIGAKIPCLCGLMSIIGRVAERIAPFLFRL